MKQTNLEKWNYYMNILNDKTEPFMDSINTLIPDIFYKVNQTGTIDECIVIKRHYATGLYFTGKKPTINDIAKIKSFVNKLDVNCAYFDYSYTWGIHQGKESISKTSVKIIDVFNGNNFFLTKEYAQIKAEELLKKYNDLIQFKEQHKKDSNYNYLQNGYKFMGWKNGNEPSLHPEYIVCRQLLHKTIEVSHNQRGSENTVSCPECKIYWKYDCSD